MAKRIKPFVYKKSSTYKRSPMKSWRRTWNFPKGSGYEALKDLGDQMSGFKSDFAEMPTTNLAEEMGITNVMEGIKNPYANIQTQFENVYEDLTIDQKAVEFQRGQFQQGQSNLLSKMQEMGMGGGAMAQIIANQNTQQSAQTAGMIGQQESANQRLMAQGAGQVQQMEREAESQVAKGAFDVDVLARQGEEKRQLTMLQGAQDARSLQFQQLQGLMALTAGELESKRLEKQADKNWFQRTFSDRKLKHNIVLVGKSPSGLNIYNFEYRDSKLGEGIYQGVMSDEIPSTAVVKHSSGYDMVDYSELDVNFIKITS
jgi:hypothetical protein